MPPSMPPPFGAAQPSGRFDELEGEVLPAKCLEARMAARLLGLGPVEHLRDRRRVEVRLVHCEVEVGLEPLDVAGVPEEDLPARHVLQELLQKVLHVVLKRDGVQDHAAASARELHNAVHVAVAFDVSPGDSEILDFEHPPESRLLGQAAVPGSAGGCGWGALDGRSRIARAVDGRGVNGLGAAGCWW